MPADRDAPTSADAPTRFGPTPAHSGAVDGGDADATASPRPALPPIAALRDAFTALLRSGALAAAAPPAAAARSPELRAAVSADVHALRASGLPPEAVVIAVKARARDALRLALAGSPPGAADLAPALHSGDRRRRAEEWLARAVTWCIDEYYRPEE